MSSAVGHLLIRVSLALLMAKKQYASQNGLMVEEYEFDIPVQKFCDDFMHAFSEYETKASTYLKILLRPVFYRRNENGQRCRKHILQLYSHFNYLNIVSNILRGQYRTY
jgi:hypothetical protein